MEYPQVVARFAALTHDVRTVQAETLAGILQAGAASSYGRAHGFERLIHAGADAYRAAVPLATYEELRPHLEKDVAALTGEPPLSMLSTSASTGKPKVIPYTPAFRESIRRAHDVFSAAVFRDFPALPLSAEDRGQGQGSPRALGLYQVSSGGQSFGGVPIDSYVSRLFDVALPEDPFFFALPRSLYGVASAPDRLYAMVLVAAGWDLRAIRATNPTTLLLFARLLSEHTDALLADLRGERLSRPALEPLLRQAGARFHKPALAARLGALGRPLVPRDLWPNLELLVTWRGGTCHLYEPFLQEQFGPVRIRAPIFAASEGVVAIPLADEMKGGVPALTSSFFEFRPLDESGDRTLLLHELVEGARYELVFSAPSGMYRYLIGDIVEVDGRFQGCPTFHFVARKGRTSSLTGEKLTELQVEDAVARAATQAKAAPLYWLLSARFGARPSYVLSVEWSGTPQGQVGGQLARLVDEALQAINLEYRAKRESDRLGPVELQETAPGAFERLQARGLSGKGAANFKLPHLSAEPLHQSLHDGHGDER